MNELQIIEELSGTPHERVLIWANKQDSSPTENPPGFSAEDRNETQRIFIAYGLISEEFSLAHEWDLTSRGRRIAQKLEVSIQSGPRRRAAVQKAILNFIYNQNPQFAEDFINEPVDGISVTAKEFNEAFAALAEWGFINSIHMDVGKHTSSRLTSDGIEAKDDHRSPFDKYKNRGTTISNDNRNHIENHGGTIGNAGAGAHVEQSGNTFNHQQLTELRTTISDLRAMLSTIEDVPAPTAATLVQMELESASDSPAISRLQGLVGTALVGLAAKIGEEAYQPLVEGLQNVATILGVG